MGQIAIRHRDSTTEATGKIAQPGSKHNRDGWYFGHARANGISGFFDLIVIVGHENHSPQRTERTRRTESNRPQSHGDTEKMPDVVLIALDAVGLPWQAESGVTDRWTHDAVFKCIVRPSVSRA